MSKYDWYIWPSYLLAFACVILHIWHACNQANRQLRQLRQLHGELHDNNAEA